MINVFPGRPEIRLDRNNAFRRFFFNYYFRLF
ncbi:hypothetical protein CP8484711_1082, partial [Chlamydia psittaci 84-8471/1]